MPNSSESLPLVSALVTTFNHDRYIEAAIESLLSQTYSNIEIIVADDGSSDATTELVKSYRGRGVRLLEVNRGGPSRAMNFAMSCAKGEIFTLQSGDDLSENDRVERQVEILRDFDLSACLPRLIDDDSFSLPDDRFLGFFRMKSTPRREDLFGSLYRDGNFLCASSVSMRRSVWATIGGFHEGLLQLQDYDYWLRALAAGCSIAIEADRLISYRIHTHNLSHIRHDVRTQRELAVILRQIGPHLPDDLLVAALYDGSFGQHTWSDIERETLRALLFVRHPSELVRQIGIDALIQLMNSADFDDGLGESFGLTRQNIFQALLHN